LLSLIKKYRLELVVFSAIFAVLLIDCLPELTWINTDSDSAHYLLAAKYLTTSHNTSAPLFLLISHLFLKLPFGSEAWRMGLISVLATTACSVFIYLSVKVLLKGISKTRLFAIIAAITYGGSALVISQSTIIESYALVTMLSVVAYYMCLKKRWVASSVFIGLTLAIHPLLAAMAWTILLIAYKQMRTRKTLLMSASFFAFYLYVPIAGVLSPINMWGNTKPSGFFGGTAGMMWMLAGGLSIWDFPKRIIDTIGILAVSMGVGFVVMVVYSIKQRTWRNKLLWLFLVPTIYFAINLASETYVYLVPAIAFGAITLGVALSKINIRIVYATLVVAVGLMIFNANYFDIGRTLDPNLSAHRFYEEELPKVGDGEIYLGGGWTWAIVYLYNKEEGRSIIPVCTDLLPSSKYLDLVEEQGIKLTRTDSESWIDKQWLVARSIAEQNDSVWLAEETIPSEFQYEIVPYEGNEHLVTRWLGQEVVPNNQTPSWKWKPSNPYDFITGAIEVSEWKFLLKSDTNIRRVFVLAVYGFGFYWLMRRMFRKKENVTIQAQKEDSTAIG